MKFVTAVSALVAAEFASAEGAHRLLEDVAPLWPQAVKSIANSSKTHKVNRLSQGRSIGHNDGKILSNLRVKKVPRKLSNPTTNQQKQRKKDEAPTNDSNLPDFGILASTPKKEARGSGRTIPSLQLKNKKTSSDNHGFVSFTSMQEQFKILKNEGNMNSASHVGDRRMEDSDAITAVMDALEKPMAYSIELFCYYNGSECETCEVISNDDVYDVKVDCPNTQEYGASQLEGIQEGCKNYGICNSCVVNYETTQVDFQGCSDGGSKVLGGMVGGLEDAMGDLSDTGSSLLDSIAEDGDGIEDAVEDVIGMIMDIGPFAMMGSICSYEEANSYCETCELTYDYDDSGEKTGDYTLQMNCPNIPEESPGDTMQTFTELQYYCSQYNMCGTCNFDPENFAIDVRDCNSESFWEALFAAAAYGSEEPVESPATEEPVETDPPEEEEPGTPATEEPVETDPPEVEEPGTPATEEPVETDPPEEEEPVETDPPEEEETDTPVTEEPVETDPPEEEEPDTPATEEPVETDPPEEEEPDTPVTEEPVEANPPEEEEPDTPVTEEPVETDPVVEEEPDTPVTEEPGETDPVVEEDVKDLESGANSFSLKPTSVASLVLLTLATTSVAQMLLV